MSIEPGEASTNGPDPHSRWRLGRRSRAAEHASGSASIHDFVSIRAARTDEEMPDELWDEMGHAAELFLALSSEGRQLRYEQGERPCRVTVSLCDLDGNFLRSVPLTESLGDFDDPAAA